MKKASVSAIMAMCLMLISINAFSWGQKGHDVTCAIAQKHLTPKAQKQLDAILGGKSLVYWANWMDNASHTPEYAYSKTWHYKNVDPDEEYETASVNPAGDVVTAIDAQVQALRSHKLSKEQEVLAVKMLIHFVGDIHSPMHMGHKCDLGGNKWQVQFFGRGKNLHSIWDTDILEGARKWSYSEWVEQIDVQDKNQIKEMVKGSPKEWGYETYQLSTQIYAETPVGSKLSYDYEQKWITTIEARLLYGGLRLANLLNNIYK